MNRRYRVAAACTASAVVVGLAAPSGNAAVPKPAPGDRAAQVVIKLDPESGAGIGEIVADHHLVVVKDVLGSRGIYLVRAIVVGKAKPVSGAQLAAALSKDRRLAYAEQNYATDASDDRFHAWPDGFPDFVGTDQRLWSEQRAATTLALGAVHTRTRGARSMVAVLDTGVDASHPVLAGRVLAGHDYVDDDDDPAESRNRRDDDGDGNVDEAYGHGTHVAGIVALVAPAARIAPFRVLDADGQGNVFAVAEAMADATEAGADVINMSFGTADNVESKVLHDAIKRAHKAGIAVVASAGNEASGEKRFPASVPEVVSVGGEDLSATSLAIFSNRGRWVRAAAPSVGIVSSVPGGGFAAWSGTSMAAPFVSGQVALLMDLRPKLSQKQLDDTLDRSSRPLAGGGKDDPDAIDILGSVERLR